VSGDERSFLFLFLGKEEEEDVRIASRRRGLAPAGPASVGPSCRWTTPFFFRFQLPLSFPVRRRRRRRFTCPSPFRRRRFFAPPALLRPFPHRCRRRYHPYPVADVYPLPLLPVRLAATSSPAPAERLSFPVRRLKFKIPTRCYYHAAAADRLRAGSHFHSQVHALPALSCQAGD